MKAGWEIKKLGDVLEVQNGYAFDSKNFSTDGLMPLIRIRDLKKGTSTETNYSGSYDPRYVVHKGDLLIGMDGEFGCHEWNGNPALLNQRVCRLQNCNEKLLKPKFLLYGINAYLKEIEEVTGYTTVKHLSSKQILNISFPIPPLHEQAHIVGILDEAFSSIATAQANTQKNLENAKAVFESHLNSVFSQRGEGWVEKKLGEVCSEITVGHVGSMANQYKESGVYFLRSQNIRPFEVSLENVVFIDQAFHQSLRKSQLRAGDLAIVRTGYPGTAAVVPEYLTELNCSDLVIVRPTDSLNPYYLEGFFNSPYGKDLVLGKLVGAAQKHFNVTAAKGVRIYVPPNSHQMDVVKQIAIIREETSRLTSLYTQKLSALEDLKKSLLHQAFTGKL